MPPNALDYPVEIKQFDPFGQIRSPAPEEFGPVVTANRRIFHPLLAEFVKLVPDVLRLHDGDGSTGRIRTEAIDTPVPRTSGVKPGLLRVFELKQ